MKGIRCLFLYMWTDARRKTWQDEMKLLGWLKGKSLINLLKTEAERAVFFCRQRQRTGQSASET